MPRVGAIAEGEARTLGEVLIHQIKGSGACQTLQGKGDVLHREFGGTKVARFEANFLSGPKLRSGNFTPASEDIAASKRVGFGASRRRRWFGID